MTFDHLHFEKLNSFWKNVLWLDKMKVEHFGYNPTHLEAKMDVPMTIKKSPTPTVMHRWNYHGWGWDLFQ